MSPQELAESAERLRRAFFKRLANKSVKARQAKSLKSRIPADGTGETAEPTTPNGGPS